MDFLEGEGEVRDYNLERLMMLSDGVFAIAMTLLALDLRPPATWDHQLASLVKLMTPRLIAYGFSVAMIGVFWIRHRRTIGQITRADMPLTILNLVVLGLVTLIPAADSIMWEFHALAGFAIYFWLITGILLASAVQWIYAAFVADLVKPSISRRRRLLDAAPLVIGSAIPATMALIVKGGEQELEKNIWYAAPLLALLVATRIWSRRASRQEAQAGAHASMRKGRAAA